MNTNYINLTTEQMEAVKSFNLKRKMFYVDTNSNIIILPRTEKSHHEWLVGELGVSEEEFEKVPRGYSIGRYIYFYRGNDFRTDDDLEELVSHLCVNDIEAPLWKTLGFDKKDRFDFVQVYCGMIPAKSGERWNPIKLVYQGEGYSTEYFIERSKYTYMTIADAAIMLNRIRRNYSRSEYQNLKIKVSGDYVYIAKKDFFRIMKVEDFEDIVDKFFDENVSMINKYEHPVKFDDIRSTDAMIQIGRSPVLNIYDYNPSGSDFICLKRADVIIDVESSVGTNVLRIQ